jgi:hypothetical protein
VRSRAGLWSAVAVVTLVVGVGPVVAGCGSSSGSSVSPAEAKNIRAVGALVAAISRINAEMDRQHKLGGNLSHQIRTKGLTPALRRRLVEVFEPAVKRFASIRQELDRAPPAADPLLAKTQRTLSQWLALQVRADEIAVTARTNTQYLSRTKTVGRQIARVTRRLEILAPRVQKKYPGVSDWKFLPNFSS